MKDEGYLFELPPADLKAAEKKFKERNPIWTGCKAKLIERYLFYFVQITRHGTYIDAFAGPQEPDKLEMWLVIECTPKWLRHFFFFEISESQVELIKAMLAIQPLRDTQKREPKRLIEIYSGDFNKNLNK